MARKTRIEYPGAIYHLINRGNYRSSIFESEGACNSFLNCLRQCCEAQNWILHAWVLMQNHYHLCVETPEANLVKGMQWLQSTFSNRFNRFRGEQGHVFQGRYKAILLEPAVVGIVCHYIHLNPVRAGLIDCEQLEAYGMSSFHRLWYPKNRWKFESFETALNAAGGFPDTREGGRCYRNYLAGLAGDEAARERLGFESLTRGWIQGSQDFRKAVLEDLRDETVATVVEAEASEIRESRYERATSHLLRVLKKSETDLIHSKKTAGWKVAIARSLREQYLVPNKWIANRLRMGKVSTVQNRVSRLRTNQSASPEWMQIKKHETLD